MCRFQFGSFISSSLNLRAITRAREFALSPVSLLSNFPPSHRFYSRLGLSSCQRAHHSAFFPALTISWRKPRNKAVPGCTLVGRAQLCSFLPNRAANLARYLSSFCPAVESGCLDGL